jgi:PEP-CTERM motif
MRMSKFGFTLAALALIAIAAPVRSYADTYQIFQLESDQDYFFYGMDDAGDVAFERSPPTGPCGPVSVCYFTYVNDVFTGATSTVPTFTADDGTPCSAIVAPPGSAGDAVCNNGREAFTGDYTGALQHSTVYTGLDPADALPVYGGGVIYMNSLGDIVFDDIYDEEFFEAVDTSTTGTLNPTPEPGSLFLVGTGALAALGTLRRRFIA